MQIIKKITALVNKSVNNGQYSFEDITAIFLNKEDWKSYSEYKNAIGESDYEMFGVPVKLTNSVGPSRCYFLHSRVTRKLGIIGTAGRNEDLSKLDKDVWKFMKSSVGKLIESTGCNYLVSGGAAWADHLAVNLYLNNIEHINLSLHLPCNFSESRFDVNCKTGRTINYHHKNFSEKLGVDTLSQLSDVIHSGCNVTVSNDSFYERNTKIAEESNILLAFTFGNGKCLKPGGTKDTFEKFLNKENAGIGFHINLNDRKIYIY
jgi:hypothetical protein